eukprot:TRINITY_DN2790_c0_g2_i1.p1 TRINITY_DN2790_c0_g2~~TRINITY_DN2790_c0_g2_i1.p1  ORF type:complete len:494 (+),score=67.22 TRINITY_DN2790_c0_g2_i1:33-1514(+)
MSTVIESIIESTPSTVTDNPDEYEDPSEQVDPVAKKKVFIGKSGTLAAVKSVTKTKFPVVVGATLLLLAGMATLVAGLFFVGNATNERRNLETSYLYAVRGYSGVSEDLLVSSFFVKEEKGTNDYVSLQLNNITNFVPVTLSDDPNVKPYNRRIFEFTGNLFRPCQFPEHPSEYTEGPKYDIQFRAVHNSTVTSNFTLLQIPVWKVFVTQLSLQNLDNKGQECTDDGGYFNRTERTCSTFFKITSICFQVDLNDKKYSLKTSGNSTLGCAYPFDTPAEYEQWNYQNDTVITFPTTDITIVSSSDPLLTLERITAGSLSFDNVDKENFELACGLIIAGSVGVVLSIIIWSILIYTQKRAWNAGKYPNSIDAIGWRQQSWIYLIFSFISFGIGLGLGITLIGHESWQPTYSWQGFWGVQVVCNFVPLGYLLFLQFLISISKHYSKSVRAGAFFVSVLHCFGLCVFNYLYLLKPWATYSILPEGADPFSRFVGRYQ